MKRCDILVAALYCLILAALTLPVLVLGISVMLFSFGPSVFFLFAARWKRLHPNASEPVES